MADSTQSTTTGGYRGPTGPRTSGAQVDSSNKNAVSQVINNPRNGVPASQAIANASINTSNDVTLNQPFESTFAQFDQYARGHLLNKYQVGFVGPYIEEALRVLDQNSYSDKYNNNATKVYTRNMIPFKHEMFKHWLDLHYDRTTGFLFMYWDATSVNLPSASASTAPFSIDTTKTSMPYKLLTNANEGGTVKMTVLDDTYFMWFNFFNALFNVQFSPLVLKARSTWQKIQMFVDVFQEATTAGMTSGTSVTSMIRGQMWEFNSCVLTNAPSMNVSHGSSDQYTFDVSFDFPNAFQGTCKDEFRYLRNNTYDATDTAKNWGSQATWIKVQGTKYGKYNPKFFEDKYSTVQSTKTSETYEALQKSKYNKFSEKYLPEI